MSRKFGSYAVRVADSTSKSKWHVEVHKSALAAGRAAKKLATQSKAPVCVFDLSRWGRKPVCFSRVWANKARRAEYVHAPSKPNAPLVTMKRLAVDRSGNPIVKLDGYRRRRRRR